MKNGIEVLDSDSDREVDKSRAYRTSSKIFKFTILKY